MKTQKLGCASVVPNISGIEFHWNRNYIVVMRPQLPLKQWMTVALKQTDETELSHLDTASNFSLCLSHMIWLPIILYIAVTFILVSD